MVGDSDGTPVGKYVVLPGVGEAVGRPGETVGARVLFVPAMTTAVQEERRTAMVLVNFMVDVI